MAAAPRLSWRSYFEAPAEFNPAEFDSDFNITTIPVRASTVDDSSGAAPYRGLIMSGLAVTTRGSDPVWRDLQPQRATVTYANADGGLIPAFLRDLRGVPFVIDQVDEADSYLARVFTGEISQPSLAETFTIEATDLRQSVLDDQIPKGTITDELFPGAIDVDALLLVVNGNGVNAPLYCILDDRENDMFLYLAPRAAGGGALTFNLLKRSGLSGDDLVTIHPEEYEILTPAVAATLAGITEYPTWATIIHFFERQFVHGSDELHKIFADISGPEIDRNFSRTRRNIMRQTWGLTQTVDDPSFDAAEAILDPSITGLYCDGIFGLNGPVRAGDVLRLVAMAADMFLTMSDDGAWVEHVDVHTPAVQLVLTSPNPGDNIVDPGPLVPRATDDLIKAVVIKFRPRGDKWSEIRRELPAQTTWAKQHGKDLVIEQPYVNNAITADKIAYRRMARIIFTDKSFKVSGLQDARALRYGDIVEVNYPPRALSAAIFEVLGVTFRLTRYDLELQGGDAALYDAIYNYVAGPLTPGLPVNPIIDYTRTPPDPATGLVLVSQIAYRNAAGQDVAAARFGFTVPTVNCSGFQFARRVSGAAEWMKDGIVHATGPQTYRVEPLITNGFYDVGVFTVNEPGNKSTEPSTSGDLITGYQAARDTTGPAGLSITATAGTGSTVALAHAKPAEDDYKTTYWFRSTSDDFSTDLSTFPILNANQAARLLGLNPGSIADHKGTQGTTYSFKAFLVDFSGNPSTWSATVTAKPTGVAQGTKPAKPGAPTLVDSGAYQGTVTPTSADGGTLSFAAISFGAFPAETAYEEVIARTFGAADWAVVGQPKAPSSYYRIDAVGLPGWKYEIGLRAVNAFGLASDDPTGSDILVFLAPGDRAVPGLPTSLAIKNQNGKTITFSATLPSDLDLGEGEYQIRSASSAVHAVGAGSLIDSGKIGARATDHTLNLQSLTYATTYHYRRRSKDATGNPTLADATGFSSGVTNGSPAVTGIAGIPIGTVVTGASLVAGTTIIAIPTPTSITLSNNWTGSTGTVTLTYSGMWTATIPFTLVKIDASTNVAPGTVTNPELGPNSVNQLNVTPGAVSGNSPFINDTPLITATTSEIVADQIDVAGVTAGARVDLQTFYVTSVVSGTNTLRLRKGTTTAGALLDSFVHGATEPGMLIASDASPGVGTQSYVLTIQSTNVASAISRVRVMRFLAKA